MEQVKKAIVVVSFGTTYADVRQSCIEAVEKRIQDAFPEYKIYRAFTSNFVIKRLAERENIQIDDLKTVLEKLYRESYTEVVIQSTHLTAGEEYENKVMRVSLPYKSKFTKFAIGRPLLYFTGDDGKPDDFSMTVAALRVQISLGMEEDQAVVFMGHGSPHQHNPAYERMQQYFDRERIPAVVGVVEETDYPNFADLQEGLQKKNSKKLILMPMLLVAGDHAKNDMAGTSKESWKNKLIAQGYEVEIYLHGLGENIAIQDLYVQHVRDAIEGIE